MNRKTELRIALLLGVVAMIVSLCYSPPSWATAGVMLSGTVVGSVARELKEGDK